VTLLAMVLAGLAASLLVRPGAVSSPGAMRPARTLPGRRALLPILITGVGVAAATLDGRALALALIGGAGAGGIGHQWARARRLREHERRRRLVVELAEALASELRAGQPVQTSLERCQELWPAFQPVVAAGRLGADVPSALARLARLPGAEGLREVASAWQVSERSGVSLSGVLLQVAESARARQVAANLVRAELASARTTARMVAALPLVTLALSSSMGSTPWAFLLGQPLGLVCLAAGTALVFCGLGWIDRIAAAVIRP
jgi:tight adherence protein B